MSFTVEHVRNLVPDFTPRHEGPLARNSDLSDGSDGGTLGFRLPSFGGFLQLRGINRAMGLFAEAAQWGLRRCGIGGIPAFLALGAALAGGAQALSRLTSGEETQSHDENTALTLATIYASMGAAVLAGGTSPFLGDFLGELASSAIQTGARLGQGGLASTTDALRFFGGSLKQGVWNILMSMGSGGEKTNEVSEAHITSSATSSPPPKSGRKHFDRHLDTTPREKPDHGSIEYFNDTYTKPTREQTFNADNATTPVAIHNEGFSNQTEWLMRDILGLDNTVSAANTNAVIELWHEWGKAHPRTKQVTNELERTVLAEEVAIVDALYQVNPNQANALTRKPILSVDDLKEAVEETTQRIQVALILDPTGLSRFNRNSRFVSSARWAQGVLEKATHAQIVAAEQTLKSWNTARGFVVNPATTLATGTVRFSQTHMGLTIHAVTDIGTTQTKLNQDGFVFLTTEDEIKVYFTDGATGNHGSEANHVVSASLVSGAHTPQIALKKANRAVKNYYSSTTRNPTTANHLQSVPDGTFNGVHVKKTKNGYHLTATSVGDSRVGVIRNGHMIYISDDHSQGETSLKESLAYHKTSSDVSMPLATGDIVVIMSDGAYRSIAHMKSRGQHVEDMTDITSVISKDPDDMSMIRLVRELGEFDDATLIKILIS